jgi:hypothetical protein
MSVTESMLTLLNEKIQSPSSPKGRAAYVKSLAAWSKAASKVAQSYRDKLGDMDVKKTVSGQEVVTSLDKVLSNVSSELALVASQIEKLK